MRRQLTGASLMGLYSAMQNMVNAGTAAAIFSTNICCVWLQTGCLYQIKIRRDK